MCQILSLDSWTFTNWQCLGNEILRKSIWCQDPRHANHFGASFAKRLSKFAKVSTFVKSAAKTTLFEIHMKIKTISQNSYHGKVTSSTELWVNQMPVCLNFILLKNIVTKVLNKMTNPSSAKCSGRGGVGSRKNLREFANIWSRYFVQTLET